jgi:hypothetical protein
MYADASIYNFFLQDLGLGSLQCREQVSGNLEHSHNVSPIQANGTSLKLLTTLCQRFLANCPESMVTDIINNLFIYRVTRGFVNSAGVQALHFPEEKEKSLFFL